MANKNPLTVKEESKHTLDDTAKKKSAQHSVKTPRGSRSLLWILLFLIFTTILFAGVYYFGFYKTKRLATQLSTLQQNVTQTKDAQAAEHHRFAETLQQQLNAQQQQISALTTSLQQQSSTLRSLQDTLPQLPAIHNKSWLLTQTDFLIKMASRKLSNEQDIPSAITLLKSARDSLTELNDPHVAEVKTLLDKEIAQLVTLKPTDIDGISQQLDQLISQVDKLPPNEAILRHNDEEQKSRHHDANVSNNLKEWRQNLMKSWHDFVAHFITINPRNALPESLLAPSQIIYLRENIRLQLLIALQALSRHQQGLYKQALETAATWARTHFNTHDHNTQTFLQQLNTLSSQSISLELPAQLNSQHALEKLMQREGLLNSSSTTSIP